jgi:hypothetical protein
MPVTTFRAPQNVGSACSRNDILKVELDSHADTCVVGRNVLIVNEHDTRVVNVSGFDPSQPARSAKIVDCAVKYICPGTGEIILLTINQALHIPELEHFLLCPMQCQVNGVVIDKCPKFMASNPTDSTHSITIQNDNGNLAHPLIILLRLEGVVSYFEFSKHTPEEYSDKDIPHCVLTAEGPDWDPYYDSFARQEDGMLNYQGQAVADCKSDGLGITDPVGVEEVDTPTWKLSQVSMQCDTADVFDDDNFGTALDATVNVSLVKLDDEPGHYDIAQVRSTKRRGAVGHIALANRWGISLEKAKATVKVTTQRGIRNTLHPTLTRRLKTNDRMLRYRRLPCVMYTNTAFCHHKYKSPRGSIGCQLFATDFGWSRAFPLRQKKDAHEALSLVFRRDDVPHKIVCDGAKESKNSTFHKKCKEAGCGFSVTEPYSPWQNTCEREIREVKKGVARTLVGTKAPIRTWDRCMEWESAVRSLTALDIYQLNGRVPHALISGETPDISQHCEFGFWQWVMFRDNTAHWPEPPLSLGKYLGPSIDVDGSLCATILKGNAKWVDRTTFKALTTAKLMDANLVRQREEFLKAAHQRLGKKVTESNCGPDGLDLVPPGEEHALYEDVDGPSFPELDDELPEAEVSGDYYMNAHVMLPVGPTEERARVLRRKRDSDGNPIGVAHRNPVLDTRVYEVQFPDGRTEEVAANVIAQALYSQCDPDGNEFVLLDSIVDWRKDDSAVKLKDQARIVDGKKVIKRSTKGWELCCEWRNGSTSWQSLKDLEGVPSTPGG